MAKPILVIKMPVVNRDKENEGAIKKNIQALELKMQDWYLFFVYANVEDITFEAFSNEQAPEIDIQELKSYLTETQIAL